MIPVLVKLSFGLSEKSPIRLYTSFGPYAGYLLSTDQVLITSQGQKLNGTSWDVRSQLRNINAGFKANAGISYCYKLNGIFIQAGGNYGLIKIQKNTSNGSNYAGAAAIIIGYTFWFYNTFRTNERLRPKG